MDETLAKQLLVMALFRLESFSQEKLLALIVKAASLSPEFLKHLLNETHVDEESLNPKNFFNFGEDDISLYFNYDIKIHNGSDYGNVLSYCKSIINKSKSLLESNNSDKIAVILIGIINFLIDCIIQEDNYLCMHDPNSEDEGEIRTTIIDNVDLFITALEQSSLKQSEKVFIALICTDIFRGFPNPFSQYIAQDYAKEVWSEVTTYLLAVFHEHKLKVNFKFNYKFKNRDNLIQYTLDAFRKADRVDDMIEFCEKSIMDITEELKKEFCFIDNSSLYIQLIEALYDLKLYDKVEKYTRIDQDFADDDPDLAVDLHKILLRIKQDQEDWKTVLNLQIEIFTGVISDKNINIYFDCKKTAEKLAIWSEVRQSLLTFLEKGIVPWKQDTWPKILADHDFKPLDLKFNHFKFPEITIALKIAMQEENGEQIVSLYDQYLANRNLYKEDLSYSVAQSLVNYDPERSITILKTRAEKNMDNHKGYDYSEDIKRFQDIKDVMLKNNQQQGWFDYLLTIKVKYRRKKKFIALANDL